MEQSCECSIIGGLQEEIGPPFIWDAIKSAASGKELD